jgi:purine-nucleoside phosphorylase
MSTVPEVVAATHCGMKVLALSLITNKVAVGKGRSALEFYHTDSMDSPIFDDEAQLATHEEVLDASQKSAQMFQGFIEKIVDSIRFDIN